MRQEPWPSLPLAAWQDTYATLHMWVQIVGKIRLALAPCCNHWWNVPFYLTARGLTTSPMLCEGQCFEIEFDFVTHRLNIQREDGGVRYLALEPQTVADFYATVMEALGDLDLPVRIWPVPVEVADPIPFPEDTLHAAYDPEYANRCWRILLRSAQVLNAFRSSFVGKCSPVHFFWGSFDLAVTRFSGRPAPEREGVDPITREAYCNEVISHGFWPGVRAGSNVLDKTLILEPAFYAYAAPEPAGFDKAKVAPAAARYDGTLKEFLLPYDSMRAARSPEDALMEFCESTYSSAADLARWNRSELER
ncbi:MAG TPA: DUF5996 family protein [Rhodocyclaceae bacterium]|nr:DUF5996 family protein [Rhodocyclaceae bacterium]